MNNYDKQSLDELAQSFTNIGQWICDFKQSVISMTSQLTRIATRWRLFPSLNSFASRKKSSSAKDLKSQEAESKD